jgi:hypothetical protein
MQKFIIFNIFLVSSSKIIHPKKNVRVTINYERDKRLLSV